MCKITIGIYLYKDEQNNIEAYCPSLNLCAAGTTEAEAKSEFDTMLSEYFDYCIANNTLSADLTSHGWKIKDGKAIAPTVAYMLRTNDIFRDIMNIDRYKKYSHNKELSLSV